MVEDLSGHISASQPVLQEQNDDFEVIEAFARGMQYPIE